MRKIYQIVVRRSVIDSTTKKKKKGAHPEWSTSRVSGRIRAQYHDASTSSWRAIRCALNEATAIPWALSSSRDTRTLNKIPPRPGARAVPHTVVTHVSRRMKASCTIRRETRSKRVLGNVRPLDRIVRSKRYFAKMMKKRKKKKKKEITRPRDEEVYPHVHTRPYEYTDKIYIHTHSHAHAIPIHALRKYFGSCKEFGTLLCTDNTHVY